jgi:hypothetical protein
MVKTLGGHVQVENQEVSDLGQSAGDLEHHIQQIFQVLIWTIIGLQEYLMIKKT